MWMRNASLGYSIGDIRKYSKQKKTNRKLTQWDAKQTQLLICRWESIHIKVVACLFVSDFKDYLYTLLSVISILQRCFLFTFTTVVYYQFLLLIASIYSKNSFGMFFVRSRCFFIFFYCFFINFSIYINTTNSSLMTGSAWLIIICIWYSFRNYFFRVYILFFYYRTTTPTR